jgi:aminobenzoyl-glutamate transport protein
VIFHGVGRHPIAGLAAAFAGVSGGFSANLLLTGLDPLLAGFTTPAAQILDPRYTVLPTANWYLMAALVPVFTVAGTLVTERVLEPRLGAYTGEAGEASEGLSPEQRRGLLWAGVATLLLLVAAALLVIPEGAPLRDPEGITATARVTPFLNSIVALMFFFLALRYFVWAPS